jgi:hypothetical protein
VRLDREVLPSPDGVARLTDAILRDDPGSEPLIARALSSGPGMTIRTLDQRWLPDVALLWVAIGQGAGLFARFVAISDQGTVLLTERLDRWSELARTQAIRPSTEAALLEYAGLVIEATRRLDMPTTLLTRDSAPESPWHRLALEALTGPADLQRQRVMRFRLASRGGRRSLREAERVLWAARVEPQALADPVADFLRHGALGVTHTEQLQQLRRLPGSALTQGERAIFQRARAALAPLSTRTVVAVEVLEPGPEALKRDRQSLETGERLAPGRWLVLPPQQNRSDRDGFSRWAEGRRIAPDTLTLPPDMEGSEVVDVDPSGGVAIPRRFRAGAWHSVAAPTPDREDPDSRFIASWIGSGIAELPRARKTAAGGEVELLLTEGETVLMCRLSIQQSGTVSLRKAAVL